ELMLGGELPTARRSAPPAAGRSARLEVRGLSLRSEQQFGTDLDDIRFAVAGGEILGIAGVAGNGQAELMAALSGETPCATADTVRFDGVAVGRLGPAARRAAGGGFVPEERNGHGAVGDMTLAENALLSADGRLRLVRHGLIDRSVTAAFAAQVIA